MLINFHTGRISDLRSLYFAHHFYRHPLPYFDVRIEYPVLLGIFMTVAAAMTHTVQSYLVVSSLGLWGCAAASVGVLWSVSRRAAWLFALCPLLMVFSLLNWDLLAICLMLFGWRAWLRQRYVSAGIWLALATFAKLYPLCLLVFCLVELAAQARGDPRYRRGVVKCAGGASVVAVLINLPFIIGAFHNWLYFWSFNANRNEYADILAWLHLLGHAGSASTNLVLGAFGAVAVVLGAVATWRGAPAVRVAALVFAAFMLLQKVNSPQYTLWLVAFALIADWDLWTIVALAMMGLVDYANAVVHIALVQQHSPFVRWYEAHIYPLAQGLRLMTTLVVAVAMTVRAVGAPATRTPSRDLPRRWDVHLAAVDES